MENDKIEKNKERSKEMIIGVIGATSTIASKAYLPVYASLQDEHRFILYSRTWEKAEEYRKKYKFEYATTDLAALETVDLVMIHAATSQHFELAKRYLSAGVHVLMDKPISENFNEVRELYDIAKAKEVLFVIAFNRRFAPQTQKLKAMPHKNVIKITKNLADHKGEIRFQLYDIFSHPLDTLIYLLDDEIEQYQYRLKLDDQGNLARAYVFLETATTSGIASMNLDSGAYKETFEVESSAATSIVTDLTELETLTTQGRHISHPNGWNSAPVNRGFEELLCEMLQAVSDYDPKNRTAQLKKLKQENILKTHEIIAEMLGEK